MHNEFRNKESFNEVLVCLMWGPFKWFVFGYSSIIDRFTFVVPHLTNGHQDKWWFNKCKHIQIFTIRAAELMKMQSEFSRIDRISSWCEKKTYDWPWRYLVGKFLFDLNLYNKLIFKTNLNSIKIFVKRNCQIFRWSNTSWITNRRSN